MSYIVKEIFYTLQGEGANAGRPAVFCRFSGCNLWSGREADRATAICQFCDTDFIGTNGPGGGKFFSASALADGINQQWPANFPNAKKFVVCTGGEPLLQIDNDLIDALHSHHFQIAVETNGTQIAPNGLDWICVSPKAGADFIQLSGNELKLVFPQPGIDPADLEHLAFDHFYLSPMDGPNRAINTDLALNYCLEHPQWHLSLQTHKLLGIP